jgi:hypothetical protein
MAGGMGTDGNAHTPITPFFVTSFITPGRHPHRRQHHQQRRPSTRADDEPCQAVRVQSGLELDARFFARVGASREQEADWLVAQSPGSECEGIGRR